MKVTLKTKEANCRVYGLEFDLLGECEVEEKVAKSLLDAGLLVEVKAERKPKR
jgi:hypothetical protein